MDPSRSSFRTRALGVPEQAALLGRRWPNLECRIQRGGLTARGEIQPTPASGLYRVRLHYRTWEPPRTFVEDPPLRRRPEEPDTPIPHTYNNRTPGREYPCLYWPRAREWRPDMYLANTIVPWLHEWLAFYEIWLVTGEWLGGGVEHGNGRKG